MFSIDQVLSNYEINPQLGFLPPVSPNQPIGKSFSELDDIFANFQQHIEEKTIRQALLSINPILGIENLNRRELERLMLMLSFFGHAFLRVGQNTSALPANIARAWDETADILGRLPIMAHASLVLQNWELIDPKGEMELDNMKTIMQFNPEIDESWFYLVTTEIERCGGPAIKKGLEAIRLFEMEDDSAAMGRMESILTIIQKMNAVLKRMYENCRPIFFYNHIRPYLSSFEEVQYQGCIPEIRSYHGGSAAQSSLLQFLDILMGINYDQHPSAKFYLREMRKYMPGIHAEFLEYAESLPLLSSYASKFPGFNKILLACKNELVQFREEHMKMVALYIMKPAKDSDEKAVGTGGTSPMRFLKQVRDSGKG